MPWIKLDVNFLEHPKIDALSCDAKLLHLWALCYSGRQLTDGFIPRKQVCDKALIVDELVTALLWHVVTGGYEIHDYLEHQSSREQVKKVRESTRKRVAKHRVTGGVTPLVTPDVLALEVEVEVEVEQKIDIPHEFDRFFKTYPRGDDRAKATRAYIKALNKSTPEAILIGAERYAHDPNRDPSYTKLAATWLNGECWNDPLLPPKPFKPQEARQMPTQIPKRLSEADVPSGGVPMTAEAKALRESLR